MGALSDRRLKQDVRPYEPGLNEVLHCGPCAFATLMTPSAV
jgi:hypothetical protein